MKIVEFTRALKYRKGGLFKKCLLDGASCCPKADCQTATMAFGGLLGSKKSRVAPETVPPTKGDAPRRRRVLSFFSLRWRRVGAGGKAAGASAAAAGPEMTLLLLGCDGGGKTTFTASLCGKLLSEQTKPTTGFITKDAQRFGCPLKVWELGGGPGIRGVWPEYYSGAHAILFLVDASDAARFAEARELLHQAVAHDLVRGKPLLVVATKQDRPHAVGAAEIAEALRVHELDGSSDPGSMPLNCHVVADRLDAARLIDSGSALDLGLSWLLAAVQDGYTTLKARVERDVAEQEAKLQRQRDERKARLAAKRKAKEEAEAAEAAAAAAAATAIGGAAPDASSATPPAPAITAPSTSGVDVGLPT